ncbi:MAG: MFS transporter [Candidatus Latescibacterota bacterium]|nr:MFS transporter [Candidatus Latescibacterota bacterium]
MSQRSVVMVSLATASSLLGDQMLYAVLPSYYKTLGLSPYQVGLILSANRIVRLLSNHFAERVTRIMDPAPLLTISLITGALLTAVYGLFSAFPVLLTARILWGVCWSFLRQIGMMTVVDSAATGRLGRTMGLYSGISRMGSICGNLVGAAGHDLLGFTAILLIFSAASLLCVPLGPISRRGLVHEEKGVGASDAQRCSPGFMLCGFASGSVGQGLLAATLGAVLAERVSAGGGEDVGLHGLGSLGVATLTGALLAARWITDLTAPLLGAVSDRIGHKRAGVAFFAGGAGALIIGAVSEGLMGVLLAVLLFYACATGVGVTLQAEAGRGGGRAVAVFVTASDLGSAVGPNAGWLLLQVGLPTASVFVLAAAVYGIAAVVALSLSPLARGASKG